MTTYSVENRVRLTIVRADQLDQAHLWTETTLPAVPRIGDQVYFTHLRRSLFEVVGICHVFDNDNGSTQVQVRKLES
jgi:hypothetical protein